MALKNYESCSTLPIYNFYKIIDEGNYGYIQKDYEEGDDFIESDKTTSYIFLKILEEYSVLTANREVLISLKLQISIIDYEFERDSLKSIVEIFNETNDFKVLVLLSSFGFDTSNKLGIDKLLKSVISRIKNLNNKIRINKVKYTKRFKTTNKEIKRNLDKEALLLEMSLDLGREIEVKKTSILKWVNMVQLSNDKANKMNSLKNK
tara:strand:- start:9994 stop:10611 length:618 start_codon:yes stop_codon:yes gene_type:complete